MEGSLHRRSQKEMEKDLLFFGRSREGCSLQIPSDDNSANVYSGSSLNDSDESNENIDLCDSASEDSFTSADKDMVNEKKESLQSALLDYFNLYAISRRGAEHLLRVLKTFAGLDVPLSLQALTTSVDQFMRRDCMKSKNTTKDSEYRYIGLKDTFDFLIQRKHFYSSNNDRVIHLNLQFNVDGLPLFKSAKTSLWPILMKVTNNCTYEYPLPINIFVGNGKPDLERYTTQFIKELEHLHEHPYVSNEMTLVIDKVTFIADAPARSFLQCVKSHTGYFGCAICRQRGIYLENHVVFPSINDELRCDEDYKYGKENNQLTISPLINIPQAEGLFSAFPPEYMHLVLLGITKRLCKYFFMRTSTRLSCRLSKNHCDEIDSSIVELAKCLPSVFSRRLRPTSYLETWKATEFRVFLLYLSPILLKPYLPKLYFDHFLLLHFGIYVFSSDDINRQYFHQAKACIDRFVCQVDSLFGKSNYVYNMHVLSHLHLFVTKMGKLDAFSSFPYESYLGILKRRIRCSSNILAQVSTLALKVRDFYSRTQIYDVISSTAPNNCVVLENGSILLVKHCFNNLASGNILEFSRSLYDYPYDSRVLNIGYYRISKSYATNSKYIKQCILIPQSNSNEFIVIPLAHKL